ncbi:calcium-binding protein, partial [Dongia deserti]|uniref:calcium-binding protein n=1 Tax=Dongia deserti TaxID=2268030 RepID=UPI0025492434
MALSNYSTNWLWGSYTADRSRLIKVAENSYLLNGTGAVIDGVNHPAADFHRIHDDSAGIPTLGYGLNLQSTSFTTIQNSISAAFGGSIPADVQKALDIIYFWKEDTPVTFEDGTTRPLTTADIFSGSGWNDNLDPLQDTFSFPGATYHLSDLQAVYLTEPQADAMLQYTLDTIYEARLTNYLTSLGLPDMPQSSERAAFVSLSYNGQLSNTNHPELGAALLLADPDAARAETWYVIRYNLNTYNLGGIVNRRLAESTMFGLYGDSGPDLDAAKAVFAMFGKHALESGANKHGQTILEFDQANASRINQATNIYGMEIPTRREAFQLAFEQVFAAYQIDGAYPESTEVVVDPLRNQSGTYDASKISKLPASTTVLIIGEGGADTLTGASGNDVIFGDFSASDRDESKEGKDVLSGGQGNDQLYGGSQDDIFVGGEGDDLLHGGGAGLQTGLADGFDTADYSTSTNPVKVDLIAGTASDGLGGTDKLISIEGVIGTTGDDEFRATQGFHRIDGGGGRDTIDWSGVNGPVLVDLGAGTAVMSNDDGTVQEILNIENASGSKENDQIRGDHNDNELVGNAGDDVLDGCGGKDTLTGGAGGDTFIAYAGTIITDPDRYDRVKIGGKFYTGGEELLDEDGFPTGDYKGANGEIYRESGGGLVIELPDGGKVTLKNWSPGDAGINLGPGVPNYFDPIVFDLDGDGFELYQLTRFVDLNNKVITGGRDSGAYFDMDVDGFKELTGWVKPDDALLVIDKNANGIIDDATELVGAGWFIGKENETANAGLAELKLFDSNQDGIIDSQDAGFTSFRLWVDGDSDGFTDQGELRTLAELGITSLGTATKSGYQYFGDSYIAKTAIFTMADGSSSQMGEAWFRYDPRLTWDDSAPITDPVLLSLPDLNGRGEVRDLRVAMAGDPVLQSLVSDLAAFTTAELPLLMQQVDSILLRWWGAAAVDPLAGGGIHNAQWTAALENDRGQDYVNGWPLSAEYLRERAVVLTQLVAQIPVGQELFPGLELKLGAFLSLPDNISLSSVLDSLVSHAPTGEIAKLQYWNAMCSVLQVLRAEFGMTPATFEAAINSVLSSSGIQFTHDDLLSAMIGGSGDDYLLDNGGNRGAFDGETLIVGGAGADILVGGYEGDTYVFGTGCGSDEIREVGEAVGLETDYEGWGGTNTVRFTSELSLQDVTFSREAGTNNLLVTINGTGEQLRILDQFVYAAPAIELFVFADGTIVPWGDIQMQFFPVSTGDDYVVGANDRDDTLDGGAGNDKLEGGTGADTYVFDRGYGVDNIVEFSWWVYTGVEDVDRVQFGPGIATIDLEWSLGGSSLEDLIVKVAGTSDQLMISGQFGQYPRRPVEEFEFTDGTVLSISDITQSFLKSTAGADTLVGFYDLDDTLDGGAGNDYLEGKSGSDTYVFGYGYGQDIVLDYAPQASASGDQDVVQFAADVSISNVSFSRAGTNYNDLVIKLTGTSESLVIQNQFMNGYGMYGIEEFRFADGAVITFEQLKSSLLIGSPGDDTLAGYGSDDVLDGGAGNDWLDGWTGADTLIGGAGNDIYVVDSVNDVVVENENDGIDTVRTSSAVHSLSWTLGANLENLVLTRFGTGIGNALNNTITREDGYSGISMGLEGDDYLGGGNGKDTLDGGVGVDTLVGGRGDDLYVVDNPDDVIIEDNPFDREDTVEASLSWTLTAGTENLVLTGSADINGSGNTASNVLTGNSGANQLSGGAGNDTLDGGAGADTLIGGTGNDTYIVDSIDDLVTENSNEGTDTIATTVTWTLGANIENLTLTGTLDINGTGNSLNNVLTGNSVTNILIGGSGNDTLNGGAGADTLIGGTGNDTYVVDNAGDVTTENEGEGADTVQSSVTYGLSANVENLTLTGSGAINGTGNELDNVLTGNTGANQLSGGDGTDTLNGGTGSDTLIGGTGNDTYVVDNVGDVTTESEGEGTDTVQS